MRIPCLSSHQRGVCVVGVVVAIGVALGWAPQCPAQIILHDELINGDLSNNQSSPTPLQLLPGVNAVLGNVTGGVDFQDWLSVTIPSGYQLTAYVNSAYASTDPQGFTGFQAGAAFVGDPFSAASYLGYSMYGKHAQNGMYPVMNLVGVNLLPIMADPNAAIGAQGFSPPLDAGTFTFLIQQLGPSTDYEFDFTIVPVPEPSSFFLATAAIGAPPDFAADSVRVSRSTQVVTLLSSDTGRRRRQSPISLARIASLLRREPYPTFQFFSTNRAPDHLIARQVVAFSQQHPLNAYLEF